MRFTPNWGLAIWWPPVPSVEVLTGVAEIALIEPSAAFGAFHKVLALICRHPVDALA